VRAPSQFDGKGQHTATHAATHISAEATRDAGRHVRASEASGLAEQGRAPGSHAMTRGSTRRRLKWRRLGVSAKTENGASFDCVPLQLLPSQAVRLRMHTYILYIQIQIQIKCIQYKPGPS
jgi:hypothetical protein